MKALFYSSNFWHVTIALSGALAFARGDMPLIVLFLGTLFFVPISLASFAAENARPDKQNKFTLFYAFSLALLALCVGNLFASPTWTNVVYWLVCQTAIRYMYKPIRWARGGNWGVNVKIESYEPVDFIPFDKSGG